ncbi:MAG: TM0106 family RecB-like putative nuclease [Gaiellaceae bacterium]
MKRAPDRVIFSPSDLNAYLECEHLTALELAVARGEVARPAAANPQADLIKRKGDEHEASYLRSLLEAGKSVATIELGDDAWDLERAAADTLAAMREGADVVYQAAFLDPAGWRGFADFVERVETPSDLGPWSYEVADTKLARHSKPTHILQLCFYSEQLAGLQGRQPERMHVILGSGERDSFRPSEFAAYYRRVRRRFLAAMERGLGATYPLPVSHCAICDFKERCEAQWDADDHLVLVASMRRDQIGRLAATGVTTLAALARATDEQRPSAMQPATFESLRDQAGLQLSFRETGTHRTQLLAPEPQRGFALLPPPSPGDLFFDIEGDPFWEPDRGLEYLWGVHGPHGFRAFWAHERAQERQALEDFVDLVHARLEADPHLHVYHYASYETSALKRLMGEFGTREDEIDDLLRREVFVDLFKVVRQALRHSHPRYSLKNVEEFYFEREAELRAGDDSIVLYEEWRETQDGAVLELIRAYNEEDCVSTFELREWLLTLRREAESQFEQPIPFKPARDAGESRPPEDAAESEALRTRLLAVEDPVRRLMAQLLSYHRREAKPVWWAFFARLGQSPEELEERDGEAIGGLQPAGPPIGSGKSLVYPFTFPAQQHKRSPGDAVHDPATGFGAGTMEALDDEHGTLRLRRGPSHEDVPLPRSLIPGGPYDTRQQRAALRRLGETVEAGSGRFAAARSILRRDLPRATGHPEGAPLPQDDPAAARELVASLDHSHLVVQGPPGSGKTYLGARLVVELIGRGRRVGISATSHKSIHNLIDEVERVALAEGVRFRGLKKGSSYSGRFVETSDDQSRFEDPESDVLLLAGTAWLFSRAEMEGVVDTLFVDEAGQVALADALAMATCARNVVLLGDPQQLAQVSQGTHPEGADASVLEHLLAGADTIPPGRGLFLAFTWRMHPDVCAFVSEVSYEGRLHSAPECARQGTAFGTGIRFVPVGHEGNRIASREEADAIAAEIERMVGGDYTDARGRTRPLRYGDFMVVAPYNAQVRCLRAALPEAVPVGTVDKFQGQEAPVVFFSMASSSGEDVPRGLGFLFSRNRLNVAISRARCLALLVASPRLLEIRCRSVEEMRLANALCRLVELASPASG